MAPRQKLVTACVLLGASMLPLLVEQRGGGVEAAESPAFVIALVTLGLALWGSFAGRVAWVLVLLRAVVQLLGSVLLLTAVPPYARHAEFRWLQGGVSLAFTVASIWLLCSRAVRNLVWRRGQAANAEPPPPRPSSRLATRGVLGGFGVVAAVLGGIEQGWLHQHLSLIELVLRSSYLVLPWAGAWLFAKLGRDRVSWTTLGALLGELGSELVSLVASGAEPGTVVLRLLMPYTNLPVLFVGLALAVFGPRRPLWQLGTALPLAQVLYRAGAYAFVTEGGTLPWQATLLAVLSGMGFAGVVYRFRRTADVSPLVPQPLPSPSPPSPSPPPGEQPPTA